MAPEQRRHQLRLQRRFEGLAQSLHSSSECIRIGFDRTACPPAEMSRLLEAAQREGKLLEDANTLNEQTRQAYIQLSQRLTADRDKYQQEIDALTSEVAAVTAQVKSTSDQLRKYWKAVHAQRDQSSVSSRVTHHSLSPILAGHASVQSITKTPGPS